MSNRINLLLFVACLAAVAAYAQSAREVRGAAAVEPLENEPRAKIVIDPPLAAPLSHGRVVIQYRTENLHMAPVFGSAALAVSPRVGHIHVSVDDASWVWVDASGEPVILNGLPPGPHKVLIQLGNANHQLLIRALSGSRCLRVRSVRQRLRRPRRRRARRHRRNLSSTSLWPNLFRVALSFFPIARRICKSSPYLGPRPLRCLPGSDTST